MAEKKVRICGIRTFSNLRLAERLMRSTSHVTVLLHRDWSVVTWMPPSRCTIHEATFCPPPKSPFAKCRLIRFWSAVHLSKSFTSRSTYHLKSHADSFKTRIYSVANLLRHSRSYSFAVEVGRPFDIVWHRAGLFPKFIALYSHWTP